MISGLLGLLLIALSGVMLVAALPRRGQVVGFLRDRYGLQMSYVVAVTCLFFAGIVILFLGIVG